MRSNAQNCWILKWWQISEWVIISSFVQQIIIPQALWQLLKPHTHKHTHTWANTNFHLYIRIRIRVAWYGPVKNNNKTNALLSNEKSPYLQCERAFQCREIAKSFLLLCYRNKNVFLRAQTFSIAWTGILYSFFLSISPDVCCCCCCYCCCWSWSFWCIVNAEYRSNVLHMYTSQMHKDTKARTHIFSTTMGKFVTSICCV